MLDDINKLENQSGKQAGMIYLFDCEHLRLETGTISGLMGPVRMVANVIMVNYPELISKVILFHCPPYINVFYQAISSFLPKRTMVGCDFVFLTKR